MGTELKNYDWAEPEICDEVELKFCDGGCVKDL